MKAPQKLWRWLTEPSASITDPEERRHAQLLLNLTATLIPLSLVTALAAPSLAGSDPNPLRQPGSLVGFGGTLLIALIHAAGRTRHHLVASGALVAVVTATVWAAFVATRHEPNAGFVLSFLALGLILSGMLLPLIATLVLCVMDVLGIAILPWILPDMQPNFVVIPALFVAITAFLVGTSSAVRAADTRGRRLAEQRLRHEEERYRNLVESSPDGIVLVSGGRIVYGNVAATKLFGAERPEQLIGLSPLADLVVPEYVDIVQKRMEAIENEGAKTSPLEIGVRRLDGTQIQVEVMGAPAMHEGRPADQTIVRDIAARKEAERAREELARLSEVNALKTQLLNMASHELNTPIAALRLQLHMIKLGGEEPDPRKARALKLLDRNVERLAALVKDVLDVAKMQSGQLRLRRADLDLAAVLDEAAELYAQSFLEKGVELDVEASSCWVHADGQRLMQVLVNLLSNALKFTPEGGRVSLRAHVSEGLVTVSVVDSGPGLTPDQMGKLFQPFSQVHDASVESKGGTGLGLHISRGILEQHGGRIWCESAGPGQGTTFAFSLPLVEPPTLVAVASERDGSGARQERKP